MRFTKANQLSFWKDRASESAFGISISIALLCFGAFLFVFRLTPFISDAVLFWMKLASFAVTGLFGTIGVFTDFKKQGQLTDFGRINLAVIALSVVVGVQAQTSEYIKQNEASDIAKKSMENLIRNNQTVLLEVRRGLEPIPESITVRYDAYLVINDDKWQSDMKQSIAEHFGNLSDLSDHVYPLDNHTMAANKNGLVIIFDEESVFISKSIASRLFEGNDKDARKVITSPFKISFSRKRPINPNCISIDWQFGMEMEYEYDYVRSRDVRARRDFTADLPGRYRFQYDVNKHTMNVEATVVLSLDNWLRNSASVLDFSEYYILVQSEYHDPAHFSSLDVEIGHRSFILSQYAGPHDDGLFPLLRSPCNDDSFIAQLPKLQ
jgi:hypothetical protein